MGFGGPGAWVQTLTSSFTGCVTLSICFNLPETQFAWWLHGKNTCLKRYRQIEKMK